MNEGVNYSVMQRVVFTVHKKTFCIIQTSTHDGRLYGKPPLCGGKHTRSAQEHTAHDGTLPDTDQDKQVRTRNNVRETSVFGKPGKTQIYWQMFKIHSPKPCSRVSDDFFF